MSTPRSEKLGMPARAESRMGGLWLAALAACLLVLSVGAGFAGADAAVSGRGVMAPNRVPPTRAELRATDRRYAAKGTKAAALATGGINRGGGLFPQNRVVALYGSAHPGFGILGRKTPRGARKKLRKQVRPYEEKGNRPVVPAFDLVATVATQCESRHDKCRYRISEKTVQTYLDAVRRLNGRLILDIQPARSTFLSEVHHWRPFLREPDVGVGLDPEWNVGRHGRPGETVGHVSARRLNDVSQELERMAEERNLPDKVMVVHQFSRRGIRHRDNVKRREHIDVTFNFDGIGSKDAKKSGYERIQSDKLFNGFSLFYKLDSGLMHPGQVLRLKPKPDYVMYQ